uniref:Uncharacterized protein n=1 Tax=Caenorhabditis japonica TaxID=281687 RepID=A0A8R1E9M3_CAEJA
MCSRTTGADDAPMFRSFSLRKIGASSAPGVREHEHVKALSHLQISGEPIVAFSAIVSSSAVAVSQWTDFSNRAHLKHGFRAHLKHGFFLIASLLKCSVFTTYGLTLGKMTIYCRS